MLTFECIFTASLTERQTIRIDWIASIKSELAPAAITWIEMIDVSKWRKLYKSITIVPLAKMREENI